MYVELEPPTLYFAHNYFYIQLQVLLCMSQIITDENVFNLKKDLKLYYPYPSNVGGTTTHAFTEAN